MSPDSQRIAIAEACGWRCTASFKGAFACWVRPDGMDHQTEWLPDYLEDLNAMHKAEKMLGVEQQSDYGERLTSLVPYTANSVHRDIFKMAHATAAQRAEAFLRTLGKWEEGK